MTRLVELPRAVHWSFPQRAFDLDDPGDLRYVYEVVLREGDDALVRALIDADVLHRVWDDLFLPVGVETAWADYFERARGQEVRRRWGSPLSRSG